MKYTLVTASSKGIGFEIAKALSFEGHNIILTGRDSNALKNAKKKLNPKFKHKIIKIDFEEESELSTFLNIINDLNIINVIHNLGGKVDGDSHPIDLNILEKSLNLNFLISLKINNTLIYKKKSSLSKIIYIGSTATLHAKASPSYVLSKSLIEPYIKNISGLLINKNILICGVNPGIVAHKGSEWDKKKKIDLKKYKKIKESQPLKRFLKPVDIAEYISSLIKIKSLAFTGSLIKLDANDY